MTVDVKVKVCEASEQFVELMTQSITREMTDFQNQQDFNSLQEQNPIQRPGLSSLMRHESNASTHPNSRLWPRGVEVTCLLASTGPAAPVLPAVGVKSPNLSLTWSLCYLAPEDGRHRRAGICWCLIKVLQRSGPLTKWDVQMSYMYIALCFSTFHNSVKEISTTCLKVGLWHHARVT